MHEYHRVIIGQHCRDLRLDLDSPPNGMEFKRQANRLPFDFCDLVIFQAYVHRPLHESNRLRTPGHLYSEKKERDWGICEMTAPLSETAVE